MKAVNKLLNDADVAIKARNILENGQIKGVYKGYVSSFAAMVIQNGLSAALAINMKTDGEGEERRKIVNAIADILRTGTEDNYKNLMDGEALLKESCRTEAELPKSRLLKEDVINASIALKLMMRTYKFESPEK